MSDKNILLMAHLMRRVGFGASKDELIEIYEHLNYKKIQINHCNKNSWSLLISK